jgi:hypothetical protein
VGTGNRLQTGDLFIPEARGKVQPVAGVSGGKDVIKLTDICY